MADMQKSEKPIQELDRVTIRFAGDSGDGIQISGSQFTMATARLGNDLSTLPDYPAEIRAPAGTLPGVSSFQISFSEHPIFTPGDNPDVLVVMNPAALKVHLGDLQEGGIIVANSNAFVAANLKKAGYDTNPLEDGSLKAYRVLPVPITELNAHALADSSLSKKEIDRCKNFYALGVVYWMYDRPLEPTIEWLNDKFSHNRAIADANIKALKTGYNYALTTEIFTSHFRVREAKLEPGEYRNVTGTEATAMGLVVAAKLAGKPLFYGSYPITPASDILHELARLKNYDVRTFQAEDEIAAMCAVVGAAYAGAVSVTGTSGPGVALKSEAIGLGVMTELPMVIVDVQRGGPSTGLPTKTEQADLFLAYVGRHGESPAAVLAAATPSDCFLMAIEAVRLAVQHMAPVILLTDGYLTNGAEPWKLPDVDALPKIEISHEADPATFHPYSRDPETLARPWVIPGQPGLEHRIGGLEKADITGNVSYDPLNHEKMVKLRAEKIQRIANDIPALEVDGDPSGRLLVLGWGGTYGAIKSACNRIRRTGGKVSNAHLRYLHPFPKNLGTVLSRFETVLVPELNLGQLRYMLTANYPKTHLVGLNKVQGKPFKIREVQTKIQELLAQETKVMAQS
jgi:2-oxoglutarate ferredoxin oxidoreductase subunit alpha